MDLRDIKGISASIVQHKIYLEDNSKPFHDCQRRLNLALHEVVRKELFEWLDDWITYPIFNSARVSHVQVILKKNDITVIKNEKNELVPT